MNSLVCYDQTMTLITTSQNRNLVDEFVGCYSSQETKRAYRLDLQDFLSFFNDQFSSPAQITLLHLVQFRDHLCNRLAAKTVNRKIATIKSFLKWCQSQGLVAANVSYTLKLPAPNVENPTSAFTDAEVSRILSAPIRDLDGLMHRLILTMLFNLGLRRSEIVKIQMRDMYDDRGTKVLKVKGKGDKQRLLPITDVVQLAVDAYLAKLEDQGYGTKSSSDFLLSPCVNFGKHVSVSTVDRVVKYYAKRAGVDRAVSPHSCRATVISHLLENQVSPRDVADFVGHSSIQTTVGVYDKKRDGLTNSAALKVRFA